MTLNRESNKIFITETQTLKRFILSTFQGSQSTVRRDLMAKTSHLYFRFIDDLFIIIIHKLIIKLKK